MQGSSSAPAAGKRVPCTKSPSRALGCGGGGSTSTSRSFGLAAGSLHLPLNVTAGGANVQTGAEEVEIEEPIHLGSWNGQNQLSSGSDHHLQFIIGANVGADMFYSQHMIASYDNAGAGEEHFPYHTVQVVGSGGFPAAGAFDSGTIYICLRHCELHVATISPQVATIPASVGNRFSEYFITTRALDSDAPRIQVTVPPSTRQVWLGMRQNSHHVRMDREELSKSTAEIDEYGATQAGGAGAAATFYRGSVGEG